MCKMSDSITNLAVSIVQFNAKIERISKDASNPFFKNNYATLDNIIDEVRPLLAAEGLAVMQFTGGDGENVTVKNMLIHESGEWLESDMLVMRPAKNDPQGVGSCVTYARRYSLASFLSLNTGEDDDGNSATHPTGSKQPEQAKSTPAPQNTNTNQNAPSVAGLVSKAQAGLLFAKHKASTFEGMERVNDILGYSVNRFEEVKSADINKLIKALDENKMPAYAK